MEIKYTHDSTVHENYRGTIVHVARGFSGTVPDFVGEMLIGRGLAVATGSATAPAPAAARRESVKQDPATVRPESRFRPADVEDAGNE